MTTATVLRDSHVSDMNAVSAVIPTRNRPDLVVRAVHSALAQSLRNCEVIVVVDGPDAHTEKALEQIEDDRLRVVRLSQSAGACQARNVGVLEARGEWVAFLDDDDEWLPTKLERQLHIAECSSFANPIVCCRLITRTPTGEYLWPRRIPGPHEPISEYLYSRHSLVRGEAFINFSMLLARKQLLMEVPFMETLYRHQDADWILRSMSRPNVGLEFAPEPLAIYYAEEQRKTISSTDNWRLSLEWIQQSRHLITSRAYAGFLLTSLGALASRQREWKAFYPLLKEAVTGGDPTALHLFLYLTNWFVPQEGRRRLGSILAGKVR